MGIFDFDTGGSMGDFATGQEGSLSDYTRIDTGEGVKIYKTDEAGNTLSEIDPESDLYKILDEKFTAEDDFDAGGTTSGIDSLDIDKAIQELGKMGGPTKQGRLFSQAPPKGQLPLSMQGRVGLGSGYRQAQNPYQTPSYLMSSAQYNQQISKLLGGLLSRSIRNNPIKYLV
jgi:hypothetical protein